MKTLTAIVVFCFVISLSALAYSADVDDENRRDSGGGNQALTGAVMGGLLGAGLGAAIGSASGHAGTGAAIGAGAGAVGGTLIGASQQSRPRPKEEEPVYSQPGTEAPNKAQIKKRVIREYDAQGNVISEKEVSQ